MPTKTQRRLLFNTNSRFELKPRALIVPPGTEGEVDKHYFRTGQFAAAADQPPTLEGYACVWSEISDDRGGYRVKLLPGSATWTGDVHALFHHDYRHLLASSQAGTLRLYSDSIGLRVYIDLPNTNAGRDVAELVRRGDVRGMSFAMVELLESETVTTNGQTVLEVERFRLDEVTVTPVPAFPGTSVAVDEGDPPASDFSARDRQRIQLAKLKLSALQI